MTYSAKVADDICLQIAQGESLRAICRKDDMPGLSTVFEWLEAHEDFRSKYARAREVQAEVMADELREIADDGTNDWMESRDREGNAIGWKENGEAIRRSALRISTRQWIASKLLPKKYGDKVQTELSGSVAFEKITREIVKPK